VARSILHCNNPDLTRCGGVTTSERRRYKEGVASFIERRTPEFDDYDTSRPLIQKANEYFEPRGTHYNNHALLCHYM
jgi:hypothetical protein